MSKGPSKHVRLDDDLAKAIEEMATALGRDDSWVIRWALRQAFNQGFAPPQVTSTLSSNEDVSLLMGEVRTLLETFRQAKSRLAVPRPISPEDAEGMRHWKDAQQVTAKFFHEAEMCLQHLKVLSTLFSGLSAARFQNLKTLKTILQLGSAQPHPQREAMLDVIKWLDEAGVK